MNSTSHTNPPRLRNDLASSYNSAAAGRNYGIGVGVLTAAYLIIVNLLSGDDGVHTGLRFAKHLLIIPVVWMAVSAYAKTLPDGRAFKSEITLLARIAAWAAVTLALVNVMFFALTSTSFEQFMHEGETLMGVMVNSGFVIFETVVFVMIIGFVILQAYKGGGSPED